MPFFINAVDGGDGVCYNKAERGKGVYEMSVFCYQYLPFDEHAFVIGKGERLRIDLSSSAWPHCVSHTNHRGLYSEQTTARVAENTVVPEQSYPELPIIER